MVPRPQRLRRVAGRLAPRAVEVPNPRRASFDSDLEPAARLDEDHPCGLGVCQARSTARSPAVYCVLWCGAGTANVTSAKPARLAICSRATRLGMRLSTPRADASRFPSLSGFDAGGKAPFGFGPCSGLAPAVHDRLVLPRELALDDAERSRERVGATDHAHRILHVVDQTEQEDHVEDPQPVRVEPRIASRIRRIKMGERSDVGVPPGWGCATVGPSGHPRTPGATIAAERS